MKIRALIVDDEGPARKKIRHFLQLDTDIDWIGECTDGDEAMKSVQEHHPDVLFLDIQMPLMDGLAFLKRSGKDREFQVIFVTAYDEYALKAFEANAIDYLLKPFTRKRFADALEKVKERIRLKQKAEPLEQAIAILNQVQEKTEYLHRLAIKGNETISFLPCKEIDWIESEDNYVLVHAGTFEHLLRESMNSMEHSLDPTHFLRIHRRIIVNVDRIREMQNRHPSRVILKNGVQLPVSRRLKDKVKKMLFGR